MAYDLNYFVQRKLLNEKKAQRDEKNREDLKAIMDNTLSGRPDLALTIYRELINRNKLKPRLVELLGIRPNSVSQMLNGKTKPSFDKFMMLILFACDELNIELTISFTEKRNVIPSGRH